MYTFIFDASESFAMYNVTLEASQNTHNSIVNSLIQNEAFSQIHNIQYIDDKWKQNVTIEAECHSFELNFISKWS